MVDLIELIGVVLLLGLGFFVGTHLERQHLRSLTQREQRTQGLMVSVTGAKAQVPTAQQVQLFTGSVVISSDFFKTFIAGFIHLFGGRVTVYETLLERARREALVRMEEAALAWGAKQVINICIQTAELSGGGNGIVTVEVVAYGTGIR